MLLKAVTTLTKRTRVSTWQRANKQSSTNSYRTMKLPGLNHSNSELRVWFTPLPPSASFRLQAVGDIRMIGHGPMFQSYCSRRQSTVLGRFNHSLKPPTAGLTSTQHGPSCLPLQGGR